MGKWMFAILGLGIVLILGSVGLFVAFGKMGILIAMALLVIVALVLKAMAGWILKQVFMAPFKMKGAVLHDAQVEVHGITPAIAPDIAERPAEISDEVWQEMQEEETERRQRAFDYYFRIDVTITPREQSGQGFTMWEPGELLLAKPEARLDDIDEEDTIGNIEKVQIWHEGAWHDDEGMKYPGPQRIRLLVSVPEHITRARFRYYFEMFGELELALPMPA